LKFPKYRTNIYVVVREIADEALSHTAVLGTFSDPVEADDFKDACAAEWFDKTNGAPAYFEVRLSTFYG
jgi:hypothetical protein